MASSSGLESRLQGESLRQSRLLADPRGQRYGHRPLRQGRPADGVHPAPDRAAGGVGRWDPPGIPVCIGPAADLVRRRSPPDGSRHRRTGMNTQAHRFSVAPMMD